MHEEPEGAHLLKLARQALLDQLLPELSDDTRYTARLVANAMAIAARELQSGDSDGRAERDALETLFGEYREETKSLESTESLSESLQRLRWRLAAEIRSGGLDGNAEVHSHLNAVATARLKIVNPRAAEKKS